MKRSVIALLAALAVALFAGPAAAQSGDATVTVVHGVPGLTVDVYVNGDPTLTDFAPGTVTDPLSLPAGDYDIAVRPADADPSSDPAISGSVSVPAGANASLVAHLDADGNPTLTPFVNDVSSLDAGKARVTVRHTAAAPAVDVRAGGTPVVEGLTNPNSESLVVDAGTVSADVVLAGTDTVVLGPTDVTLAEGTSTIVYAYGSAEEETLSLAVQTITGLHSAPTGVPAGDAGLAAAGGGLSTWILVTAAVLGLALLAAPRLLPARTRR